MAKVKVFGTTDEKTMAQAADVASRAERVALMADNHLGYIMPIGGVAAYDNKVSVAGVGFDIGCGNTAMQTNLTTESLFGLTLDEINRNPFRFISNRVARELADDIFSKLSFGVGRTNKHDDAPVDHELFHDAAWWAIPNIGGYRETLMDKARDQLGTIGGGNHYVDVFADEDGYVWVGVHFGSRGLGHTIASNFLALTAGETWGTRVKEHEGLVHLQNPIGHDYWQLKELASRYAFEGREWVCRTVAEGILGGTVIDMVANHHNDAWKENHDGKEYVVVRKGATPAWPGQRGFVGGSMGENAVILEGSDSDSMERVWQQKQALYSTVHGAGRKMGRREAKRVLNETEVRAWLDDAGVILRGGGLDEAPQAYKRLPEVLEAQGPTVRVVHQLKPLIVAMAPGSIRDPYKD